VTFKRRQTSGSAIVQR